MPDKVVDGMGCTATMLSDARPGHARPDPYCHGTLGDADSTGWVGHVRTGSRVWIFR